MASRPRRPTLAIVIEEVLRPYIRDSALRQIVALLIVYCWRGVLAIALIVTILPAGAAVWIWLM